MKHETLNRALEIYGSRHQILKAIEEMSELQLELTRFLQRTSATFFENIEKDQTSIKSEIADVAIMLYQLSIIFGQDDVDFWIERKMQRLEKRLNGDSDAD